MIPEDGCTPGDKTSKTVLDGLTIELTVLAAKRHAALLPTSHVPLLWLRELATTDCPALVALPRIWETIVSILVRNQYLLAYDENGAGVYACGPLARATLDSMEEGDIRNLRDRLRVYCSGRLETNRAEERRLINRIMTGDPNTAVTAWNVPSVEEVRERAAGDSRVEVVEYGDGTYSVQRKRGDAWEMDCLRAFAVQEFIQSDLKGVAWALRTKLLTFNELRTAEDRIGRGHLRNPDSNEAALVAGQYWLNLAAKCYGEGGSSRTSWHLSKTALNIFESLSERQPDDQQVTELLTEAKKAYWAYDD